MRIVRVTKLLLLVLAFAATLALGADIASLDKLDSPRRRGATYDEIRAHQSLGRVVTSPTGDFFLYEWSRPYDWSPDVSWLAAAPAARAQTWMYRVDANATATTSRYIFQPDSGSTYYLGSISPNHQRASFYAIDHDDSKVRTGVVTLDDAVTPTIIWFEAAPDDAKLHLPPVWVSDDEIVYPAKDGAAKLVRANVTNGDVRPCVNCDAHVVERAMAAEERAAKAQVAQKAVQPKEGTNVVQQSALELPRNAKLLARSENGNLSIYSVDTPDVLSLLFVKGDEAARVLFQNER